MYVMKVIWLFNVGAARLGTNVVGIQEDLARVKLEEDILIDICTCILYVYINHNSTGRSPFRARTSGGAITR